MAGTLSGLKVVDLSRVLAGPLCTQMLADHGAQVVKVEPPSGDETRHFGPPFDANGNAAYFGAVNRGKRSITLDLSQPDARTTFEALLEDADVLVENFLPGTLERWNLGYEQVLRQRHPSLIYCSIAGFGADGPLGGLPGYDAVLQAMCGVMSINGTAESGPTRVGIPIVDYVTGCNALTGILLALQARHLSGWGQRVEVALFDTALSLLAPHASNWLSSGRTPCRLGSAHPNIAPRGTPKEIVDRLNAEVVKILALPETRQRLLQLGFEPAGGTPSSLRPTRSRSAPSGGPADQGLRAGGRLSAGANFNHGWDRTTPWRS